MHEDLERTGEVAVVSEARPPVAKTSMLDVRGGIAEAERMIGSRILEDGANGADTALVAAETAASEGERVAVVAPAHRFAQAREAMRRIAQARLGLVAHAIAGHGTEDLAALLDLGWGVLTASGPEDSFDLALVARRAAEDSGVPFVVVHALGRAGHPVGRALAMVGIPRVEQVEAFVGPASRLKPRSDAAHPSRAPLSDRAFAERVPFALGSALRDYGAVSGRRHDVFDKAPLGEPHLVLVGAGPVGDALFCATSELRSRGYDVGAIHLSTLRPFPGARLVKALARALAVTILEPADEPMAQGGILAREIKSAFTDALTWAPGFPGIGRVPKLFVGTTGPAFDVADLAAICENMLADERGKRVFSLSDTEHALPRTAEDPTARAENDVAMRWVLDGATAADAALHTAASVLATAVGLRSQGIVTEASDGRATVDVLVSRLHARGGMARRPPRIVFATESGVATAGAVAALGEGAVLAVLTQGGDSANLLPDAARALVREKRVRVLPLPVGHDSDPALAVGASLAGASLAVASRAAKAPIDGASVAAAVTEHFVARGQEAATAAGARARAAFDATLAILRTHDDGGRPIGVA